MAETMYDRIKNQGAGGTTSQETPPPSSEQQIQAPNPSETTPPADQQTTPPPQEQQPPTGQTPSEDEKKFDVKLVNDYFGTTFENDQTIREIFESQNKFKDFETQLKTKDEELVSFKEKYNSLIDAVDPNKIYSDKEALALTQLQVKYPHADASILQSIRKTDLTQMDHLNALMLIDKLNVPSTISDADRERGIFKKLGIDAEDRSELTGQDQYLIDSAYVEKVNALNEIKDFQPELGQFDFEAEQAARKKQFEENKVALQDHNGKALDIILNSYKETKSKYGENGKEQVYSFTVSDDFKQKNRDAILAELVNSGIKIDNTNANEIAGKIDDFYWTQNRHEILNDAVKQALSKEREQTHSEIHSDSPTNTNEAPATPDGLPKTIMESFRSGKLKTT